MAARNVFAVQALRSPASMQGARLVSASNAKRKIDKELYPRKF
jgi:hypothetical protein